MRFARECARDVWCVCACCVVGDVQRGLFCEVLASNDPSRLAMPGAVLGRLAS